MRRRKESKEEKKRKKEKEKSKDQGMYVLESNIFWIPRALVRRIDAPFGLGFVQRSHKPLNCWGCESKTPIGVK